jgi:hypothetical protein
LSVLVMEYGLLVPATGCGLSVLVMAYGLPVCEHEQ